MITVYTHSTAIDLPVEDLGNALLSLAFLQHHPSGACVCQHMAAHRLDHGPEHAQRAGVGHALVDHLHNVTAQQFIQT